MAFSYRRFTTALLTCLLAGVAQAHAQEPVKIGVSTTLSPPGSVVQGVQVMQGLEIAAEYLNEKGGILGRKVELAVEDDQGLPEKGRTAAERLVSRDGVIAVTGQISSSVVLAQQDVIKQANVPLINTNGWADAIREKGYPQVFNPAMYTAFAMSIVTNTVVGLKAQTVVALGENTDSGFAFIQTLEKQLKEKAPNIKFRSEILDRSSKDFLPTVLKIKQEQPDVVINFMLAPAAYMLLNQLQEQGVTTNKKTVLFEAAGIIDNPDFWRNTRRGAVGLIAYGSYHPNINMPPLGKEFLGRFRKKHPQSEPGRLYFQAVDSILVVAEAARVANSVEPNALIKALQDIRYTGARGEIVFDRTPGPTFQQWIDVPYVVFQVTAVDQKIGDMTILQQPGQPLDLSLLRK